jgi:hypothetical protein
MTNFVLTPTYYEIIDTVLKKDPITGQWSIPRMIFDHNPMSVPLYSKSYSESLDQNTKYQKKILKNIYTRLTEKWLRRDVVFKKLLKYFNVEEKNGKLTVSLITDIDKPSKTQISDLYSEYIFAYMEKIFITKKTIEKIIRKYVKHNKIKWYDLLHNIDIVKELIAYKLKKIIEQTIYDSTSNKQSRIYLENEPSDPELI